MAAKGPFSIFMQLVNFFYLNTLNRYIIGLDETPHRLRALGECLRNQNMSVYINSVTHMCVVKLTIIGSNNGLSPGRRQTITCANAGILLIGPLWTNFNEIVIEIHTFSFKKMRLKMSTEKWWPFCLGLKVLRTHSSDHRGHSPSLCVISLITNNILMNMV